MMEAVSLLALTEGILLDPVYSGKGMARLIGKIRKGTFSKNENIVFVHTGGSAALFVYEVLFKSGTARYDGVAPYLSCNGGDQR